MSRRVLYGVLWVALVAEAVWLAPPPRTDQGAFVLRLLTGAWAGEEPSVVAVFQLLGVWPLALAALLAPELRRRPVPLWPFAVGSMAAGAFALLPGLVLGGHPTGVASWQRWLGHRAVGWVLLVPTLALMGWGVWAGDPRAYVEAWLDTSLVHVMTLDFGVLWVVSMIEARRQAEDHGGPWWLTLVPLVGLLGWLAARPSSVVADR